MHIVIKLLSSILILLQSLVFSLMGNNQIKFGAVIQEPAKILWNQEIVEKRDYDALHYKMSDDSVTAIFGAGLNYKDANGNFQRVRPSLVDKGTYFGMEASQADLRLPKTFKGQKQLAGEVWNHTIGSNDVSGERFYIGDQIDGVPIYGLRFREAYPGVDVEYKPLWKGVHEEYVIKSSTSTHIFQIDKPLNAERIIKNGRTEIVKGKLTIKDFYILNKNGKELQEPHSFTSPTNELEPTITDAPPKIIIEVPLQPDSEYPLTLDPSPFDSDADNSAFFDGFQANDLANGTAWATLHNEAVGGTSVTINPANDVPNYFLNMYAGGDQHEIIRRFFYQINSSSIGSGATISSSTFKIVAEAQTSSCTTDTTANDALGWVLINSKQSTTSNPGTSQFNQFGDTIDLERAEQLGPEINFLSATLGGKTIVIYSTTTYTQYISLTGTTTLGLVGRGDQSDINPNTFGCSNNGAWYDWSTSLNTTEANRPILLVAYTGSATAPLPANNKYVPGFMGWLKEKALVIGLKATVIPVVFATSITNWGFINGFFSFFHDYHLLSKN